MPSVLKNVLRFTGLVVGVPAQQPHGLNYNGAPHAPHFGWASSGGFTIVSSATHVTVTRGADAADAVDVAVELWHSIENAQPLPSGIAPGLLPFIVQGGSGGAAASDPTILSTTNGDVAAIVRGAPVVLSGGQFVRGDANAAGTAPVIGLARVAGAPGQIVVAQVLGVLTLTTAEWDAVTGQVGGLTPNASYYLSTVTGRITTVAPVNPGEFVVEIGRAVTSTIMLIQTEPPILL